jgi:protein-S-isoprenylcysteine O-methyltransferase Ste14
MRPELWLLAVSWLGYFVLHSVLASLSAKRYVAAHRPAWMPAYRLVFNVLAVALLAPPLYLVYADPGPPLWAWTGAWGWLADALTLTAIGTFLYSLRHYDLQEFLGFRQWRDQERRVEDQERLRISPLHRYVRHPWYALGLVIIWTRDMSPEFLLTALLATAYFWYGSRLEERKLITYHGDAYRRYRKRVPALVPSPWRHLSAAEAATLEREQANRGNLG